MGSERTRARVMAQHIVTGIVEQQEHMTVKKVEVFCRKFLDEARRAALAEAQDADTQDFSCPDCKAQAGWVCWGSEGTHAARLRATIRALMENEGV